MRILIALLTMIPAVVFGQEKIKNKPRPFEDGYIIYGDDRGIEQGLIQVPEKKRGIGKCYFRKSYSGVVREIQAEQVGVLGFGFAHGAVYHVVDYTHDSIPGTFFVKVMVDGTMSLYADHDALILKLQSGTTFELTSTNYRDVLQTATAACPAASQMAQYLRFDPAVLTDFIKGYNKCLKNDPATFDPFTKKRWTLGILSGVEFSYMMLDSPNSTDWYLTQGKLYDQKMIQVGVNVTRDISSKVAVSCGVVFKPRRFHGTTENKGTAQITEVSLTFDEIQIPLDLHYTFLVKPKWSLHCTAGGILPFVTNVTSRKVEESESFGTITTVVTQPIADISKSIQLNLGIGGTVLVWKKHRLFMNVTGILGNGTMKAEPPASQSLRASFLSLNSTIGLTL